MKEHYIVKESWVKGVSVSNNGKNVGFIPPLLSKNTAIVVISRKNNKIKFYRQGHGVCTLDSEIFESIPKIPTTFTDEYINEYIIPNKDIKILKKIISTLRKVYKGNKLMIKTINTLNTWIFSTKGSKAINGAKYNKLDFENLEWVLKSNLKTKPYDWYFNRSGRTTASPSDSEISEWEKNPKDVLPIGIQKNEQCSYPEMYEIGKKILQEVCGMEGVPQQIREIIKENISSIDLDYKHYDYMIKTRICFDMFLDNTHHGKKKGLELCHKNPKIEFATSCENITIGLSESNRSQGYNTFRELIVNGANCIRIDSDMNPLTPDEENVLIKIALTIDKFTL
jgi:hypothetical protein